MSTRLVLITGLSGSGKSTALHALEDLGFFCIDNLPIVLLPRLLDLGAHTSDEVSKIALVADARDVDSLPAAPAALEAARAEGHQVDVLFLDAKSDVLLRRFSETRRRHPLANGGSVEQGIAAERAALEQLRRFATEVVDTSRLTVHELKQLVQDRFASSEERTGPTVSVLSFGFKHGVPPQVDLVFDVRFLPNPYFVETLKPLTGLDTKVAAFVLERDDAKEFVDRIESLLEWLIPRYRNEGKAHLTVGIGCTGGQHRSVAIAERLADRLVTGGRAARTAHRDIPK